MRRIVILLLTILLSTTTSFSQNISEQDSIVAITPKQLKETNLIFLEHKKLLLENYLLNCQVNNYRNDNKLLIECDSIKTLQLQNYKELSNSYTTKIELMNKKLVKKTREVLVWKIGSISISTGLFIWLLLK